MNGPSPGPLLGILSVMDAGRYDAAEPDGVMDSVFQERISRRTLLKAGGGLLLASIVDFRLPGRDTVAMTRMQWVERDVFPATGLYQSPVFTTDQPFNSIEVNWIADQPSGSELRFAARAKVNGSGWTDWVALHRDSHGRSPSDASRAYSAPVLVASSSAVQYQVELVPNALGESPKLSEVEIACVDTSPPAQYMAANLIDGWIIPRAGWGPTKHSASRMEQRSGRLSTGRSRR